MFCLTSDVCLHIIYFSKPSKPLDHPSPSGIAKLKDTSDMSSLALPECMNVPLYLEVISQADKDAYSI